MGGGTGDGLLTIAGDCTGLYRDDVLVGAPGARLHLVSVQMEVRDQPPAQAASLFLPLVTR